MSVPINEQETTISFMRNSDKAIIYFKKLVKKNLSETASFFTIVLYICKITVHYIYVIKFCQKVRFI